MLRSVAPPQPHLAGDSGPYAIFSFVYLSKLRLESLEPKARLLAHKSDNETQVKLQKQI